MGVFGKKPKKMTEEERKAQIAKTVTNLEFFSDKIAKKIDSLVQKGKQAKAQGFSQQYNVCRAHVKRYLALQKQAEGMLLTIGIMEDVRDMATVTNDFLTSINLVSKETMQIIDSTDFNAPITPFTKALDKIGQNNEKLDTFLDQANNALDDNAVNSVEDEDVDMLFADEETPAYMLENKKGANYQ